MGKFIDFERYAAKQRSKGLAKQMLLQQRDINLQINEILKRLDKLPEKFTKRRRSILLGKSAKIFVKTVQSYVPISDRPHKRWKDGKHVATYLPMNLYNSIQVLRFRKSNSVFVGPKLTRNKELETFGASEKTTSPYYAWMVENGTKYIAPRGYMRKGYDAGKYLAMTHLSQGVEKIIKQYERKHKINGR
jgi:hypothetical protein